MPGRHGPGLLSIFYYTLLGLNRHKKERMKKSTTTASANPFRAGGKRRRPGRHSKCKQSKNRHGKNYSKPYGGQGR